MGLIKHNQDVILGIDPGKHMTKGTNGNKPIKFMTRVLETDEELLGKGYVVEFNNRRFIVSDELNTESYDTDKAIDEHKVAAYLALYLLSENYNRAFISLGCPINTFFNKEKREEYVNFMFPDDIIEITVNDVTKKIFIGSVKAFPESIGAIYNNPAESKGKLIGVIDIGGLNASGCMYNNRKPVPDTDFCINQGGSIVFNAVKKELNRQLNLNFQDFEIPFVIENGVTIKGQQVKAANEIIGGILNEQVEKIIKECKRNNWNIDSLDIVCIGGGSILLEEYLKKHIPHARMLDNPSFINAIGFYNMANSLHKKAVK